MGYRAKGRVELISTKEIDELVIAKLSDFLETNKFKLAKLNSEGLHDDKKNTLRVLVAFAGFDLSDSDFGYVLSGTDYPNAEKLGQIMHTIRLTDVWEDQKGQAVLDYFASLGMGVYGDFEGEDGLEWAYTADFGKGTLVENFLESISTNELDDLKKKAALLDKLLSILGVTVEELTDIVESEGFATSLSFHTP